MTKKRQSKSETINAGMQKSSNSALTSLDKATKVMERAQGAAERAQVAAEQAQTRADGSYDVAEGTVIEQAALEEMASSAIEVAVVLATKPRKLPRKPGKPRKLSFASSWRSVSSMRRSVQ